MKRGIIGSLALGLFLLFAIIATQNPLWISIFASIGGFFGVILSGGGEFNPAASIVKAIKSSSAEKRKESLMDMSGSFVGFFLAALAVRFIGSLLHVSMVQTPEGSALYLNRNNSIADVAPQSVIGYGWNALLYEVMGTVLLVLVIVLVGRFAVNILQSAICVGLTIGLGVFCLGALTGGSLNFARYLGPALLDLLTGNGLVLGHVLFYLVGNLIIPVGFVAILVQKE